MKKRHKPERIIQILREAETAGSIQDTCRKHGISEQTYYRWRKQHGNLSAHQANRLKVPETENQRLKRLVAEQALDLQACKEVYRKKGWR